MTNIDIKEFGVLEDAMYWLESMLYEYETETDNIKAEVLYVNMKWRVGIVRDDGQLELGI